MGRLILVQGGNRSGKSLFAERLVSCTEGKRYYIATMIRSTEDNLIHIEKHRRQRQDLNFETLELPFGFEKAELEEGSVVLLEDVSNLLANLIFEKNQGVDRAYAEIEALREKCAILVAVSISGMKGDGYEGETLDYINKMNEINSMLCDISDAVIEMENRVPVIRKGEIGFADESLFHSAVHI